MSADNVNAAIHSRDGIAAASHSDANAPLGAELLEGNIGGSATVPPFLVASEYEHFSVFQRGYVPRCDSLAACHNVIVIYL